MLTLASNARVVSIISTISLHGVDARAFEHALSHAPQFVGKRTDSAPAAETGSRRPSPGRRATPVRPGPAGRRRRRVMNVPSSLNCHGPLTTIGVAVFAEHRIAVGRDQHAFGRSLEVAGSGQHLLAVVVDDEEAAAANGEIGRRCRCSSSGRARSRCRSRSTITPPPTSLIVPSPAGARPRAISSA